MPVDPIITSPITGLPPRNVTSPMTGGDTSQMAGLDPRGMWGGGPQPPTDDPRGMWGGGPPPPTNDPRGTWGGAPSPYTPEGIALTQQINAAGLAAGPNGTQAPDAGRDSIAQTMMAQGTPMPTATAAATPAATPAPAATVKPPVYPDAAGMNFFASTALGGG